MSQTPTLDPVTTSSEAAALSGNAALAARSGHLSPVLARYFQRGWVRGEGHRLYDADGKEYLDFACGLAVTILGHAHPAVSAAIHEQTDQLLHMCNGLGYLPPVTDLADALVETLPAPLDSVLLANSGAEAIEGAVKLARRVTGRPAVIGFSGAFHGRTYAPLSMTTSNLNYRVGHGPFLPDTYVSQFPSVYRGFGGDETAAVEGALASLQRLLAEQVPPQSVAAFLIESVQGEGGYDPVPAAFYQELRTIADRHGILLIADEVQSGLGRTGRMWGFEHAGIVPDVVCIAKGIANGLPLSAVVASTEHMRAWGAGAHGSTFGGNPVSCAAGVAVLRTIREERLVENAAERGAQLTAGLRAIAAEDPRIGDVRGPGLMIGVEFVTDRETRTPDTVIGDVLIARCADLGLLLLTCGPSHNVVRWIAPLDVTADEVDEALGIFRTALAG
ncbi:MAG: aspartate aminotransferase family protein [Chloroflexi bacterium]|nr:aspartate aminotransferase family protein [Chloroflexota bacterium]